MLEKEIGNKIRKLRSDREITLGGLAERTGLTIGYLSKIERGLSSLPIATLGRIAAALHIQIAEIFDERVLGKKITILYPHERKTIKPKDRKLCYMYEPLAFSFPNKLMEPFVVTLPPHCNEKKRFTHQGEEMVFLLQGKMDFFHGSEHFIIEQEGTCLYFDASIPHCGQCRGDTAAKFLSVFSLPQYPAF